MSAGVLIELHAITKTYGFGDAAWFAMRGVQGRRGVAQSTAAIIAASAIDVELIDADRKSRARRFR